MEEQRYPQLGDHVLAIQKIHYDSGELTEDIVQDVLTKKRFHPRGHKVRLTSGIIARVQKFLDVKTVSPDLTKEKNKDDNYFEDPQALR